MKRFLSWFLGWTVKGKTRNSFKDRRKKKDRERGEMGGSIEYHEPFRNIVSLVPLV